MVLTGMKHVYINPKFQNEVFDEKEDFLLFLHAQRTGGSALRHVITRAWSKEDLYCTQFVKNFQHWKDVDEETLEGFKGLAGHSNFVERSFGRRVRLITLLRHPVLRNISLYYYIQKRKKHPLNEDALSMSLSEFYFKVRPMKLTYFDNVMCRRISGKPDFQKARDAIENDFWMVGMSEYLGSFVSALLSGLAKPGEETPDMGSDLDKYRDEVLDRELVEAIFENNKADTKLFNYMNDTYLESAYAYPAESI